MESKKFNQKLRLNKQTIANLNATEMSRVYGGVAPAYDSVNYCDIGVGVTTTGMDLSCYTCMPPVYVYGSCAAPLNNLTTLISNVGLGAATITAASSVVCAGFMLGEGAIVGSIQLTGQASWW